MVLVSDQVTSIPKLQFAYPVFSSLSALVNIILAALIVSRLVYYRRYIKNTLGVEYGSPYTNIITMCIESSALMVIASSLFTILGFVGPGHGGQVMFDIIPHICVGDLELEGFWCMSKIFIPLGYLPAPHCLSRCPRPCHTINVTAIGASGGPDKGQHPSFKPFRSRRRGVRHCPYSTTSSHHDP